MLATLAALAAGAGPNVRTYDLRVRGAPRTSVALRSAGPAGWVETFCTSRLCALGHVVVLIPPGGTAVVRYAVYRTGSASAPRTSTVTISGDVRAPLQLTVTVP